MIDSRHLFSPTLLRSFAATVDEQGFTRAANILALQQSTVSQHVQRLEQVVGRRLLNRNSHAFELTADGEKVLEFAREILASYQRLDRQFSNIELQGRIRVGSQEEFAVFRLARILQDFRRLHKKVQLEVVIAPSRTLFDQVDAGRLDLVIGKQRTGEGRGTVIRRERLHWYGMEQDFSSAESLPLILYQEPSIARDLAIEACETVSRAWNVTAESGSYLGLRAAVLAGLGVTALGESTRPMTIAKVSPEAGLPPLADMELILFQRQSVGPVDELAAAILERETATDLMDTPPDIGRETP